jgi:hypothetical protein
MLTRISIWQVGPTELTTARGLKPGFPFCHLGQRRLYVQPRPLEPCFTSVLVESSAILKLGSCSLVVAQGESDSIGQSSQVQIIADYAKLSLSNDRPIMLALKKFIPCYAAALCIKTPSALLAL